MTSLESVFKASSFNSDISRWNVYRVTSLESAFESASSFNVDISSWNVRQVTSLESVFKGASNFNSDISRWNVHQVTSRNAVGDINIEMTSRESWSQKEEVVVVA